MDIEPGDPILFGLYADDSCCVIYYIDVDNVNGFVVELVSLYHTDE